MYFGEEHTPEDAALLEAGPSCSQEGVGLHPAQHGYTTVHNYALYFWRPYLGNTVFALWELLLSFCYGDTDIVYPSISRLARMLTNSDHSRAVVRGRRSAKTFARSEAKARYPGALQVLRRERLVQVFRRGRGPATRYTFRVLKVLPLLRPDQVARLSPRLQRDHADWLERYGIDEPTYQQAFARGDCPPAQHQEQPSVVPVTTSADGDHNGEAAPCQGREAAPHQGREAQRNTGEAGRSTNNPQEELYRRWWQEAVQEMRSQLSAVLFQACLVDAQACSFQDGVLTVQAPSAVARKILQRQLVMLVRRTVIAVSEGQARSVCFLCSDQE
jgi:hypothetical protein